MKNILLIPFAIFLFICSNALSQDFLQGVKFYHEKKYDEAISIFNSVRKGTPQYGESLFYLGKIHAEQNKLPEAQGFLEKAVNQNSQNPEFHMALGTVYTQRAMQANTLMQAMYAGKIRSSFEKVAELDNNNIQARWYLFGFYARAPKAMGGDMNKSKRIANEIRRIHPAEGSRAWGQIYQMEQNFEEAEKAFKRAVTLMPDSLANHTALGSFYSGEKRYDEAFSVFKNALKRFPENRNLFFQIGRTASLSGQNNDEGINALKRYIDLTIDKNSPSLSGAYYHMGQIEQKRGNKSAAKINYERALKLNNDHKPSKEALENL